MLILIGMFSTPLLRATLVATLEGGSFGRMPPTRSWRSMKGWKRQVIPMPSGCPRTRCSRKRLRTGCAARGATVTDQAEAPLQRLPVSGRILGPAAPCYRQDRMAPGRAVSDDRLHRHQPAHGAGLGGAVLQSARHGRAADQGRQICLPLDAAVMPEVPRQ